MRTKFSLLLFAAFLLLFAGCKKDNKEPADDYSIVELSSTATQAKLTAAMLDSKLRVRINGTINAADFKVLHENTTIEYLDLSGVKVVGDVIVGLDESGDPLIQTGNALPLGAFGEYSIIEPGGGAVVIPANKTIKGVVLPKDLIVIGRNVFANCSNLSEPLVFPAGLEKIMNEAFFRCTALTGELHFPERIEIIGESAFSGCTSLTGTLTIPKKITLVPPRAFMGCHGITELVLNDDLDAIAASSFAGMRGLTKLTLPKNLDAIGFSAFQGCTGLRGDLVLPESLEQVQDRAFVSCGFDGKLVVNKNLSEIQEYAFDDVNFKTIILPWEDASEIPPKWSYNVQWFPEEFETKSGKPEYIIYIPAGTMSIYEASFPAKDAPGAYFNFKEGRP